MKTDQFSFTVVRNKVIAIEKPKKEQEMKTENEIEKMIVDSGAKAPRLCPADIDAVIVGETYTVLPSGKCMICEMTLKNGFTVRGESSCVSKENFNIEIGKKISREDARNKIWGFEGYLLQQRVYEVSK